MKLLRNLLLCGSVAVALTACGSDTSPSETFGEIKAQIQQLRGSNAPAPSAEQIKAVLTPEVRAQFGNRPFIVTTMDEPPISAGLFLVSDRQGKKIYQTVDNIALTLDGGIVVATRGLGFDLMDADVRQIHEAIRNGGGRSARVHRYLDGENHTVLRAFDCVIEVQGTSVVEKCYGYDTEFENTYRTNQAGAIVASRQWLGPERGFISIEDLG